MDLKNLVAQINIAKAAKGNGGLHVVRPVEQMLLTATLSKIGELETLLEAARNDARSAARRAGVKIDGLFGNSSFIRRETGERWADESFERGKRAGYHEVACCFLAAAGKDADAEFARIRSELKASKAVRKAEAARWRMVMTEAGFFDAVDAGDYKLAAEILRIADPGIAGLNSAAAVQARIAKQAETDLSPNAALGAPTNPKALAAAIHKAAAKAKSSTDSDPPRPMNALSKGIIDAGRKRRGGDDR